VDSPEPFIGLTITLITCSGIPVSLFAPPATKKEFSVLTGTLGNDLKASAVDLEMQASKFGVYRMNDFGVCESAMLNALSILIGWPQYVMPTVFLQELGNGLPVRAGKEQFYV
jgi:hypothetical protein